MSVRVIQMPAGIVTFLKPPTCQPRKIRQWDMYSELYDRCRENQPHDSGRLLHRFKLDRITAGCSAGSCLPEPEGGNYQKADS
jgi:hypothetical protein